MNIGDLKKYLSNGKRREDMKGVPMSCGESQVCDESNGRLAKTFLKVTLAQHDKIYHKGGYHEGDACNFREALKRGDSVDEIADAEKKEGGVRLGFVTFREDEKTGKKVLVGIEEAKGVVVEGKNDEQVEVACIDKTGGDKGGKAEDRMPHLLEEHDKRFHPNGYRDGDSCKYRDALKRGDSADRLADAEADESAEKRGLEGYIEAYKSLAEPLYSCKWNDGKPISDADMPRVRSLLDKFMLAHPEVANSSEDAQYDLNEAIGRTPGWHRNDMKAERAEAWSDGDIENIVAELNDAVDGTTRNIFDVFYPESHFADTESDSERDADYVASVALAVNWAMHDNPEVWVDEDEAKGKWTWKTENGHRVDIGAIQSAVRRLIGAAATDVAKRNYSVSRYLSAK